jgi:hypothetical protein
VDDGLEVGKLLILIITRIARGIVDAVEDLHADYGVDVEEEKE